MKAKICGITCLSDALFAAKSGAWAIGFNFYRKSPRYIEEETARFVMNHLPLQIIKVGIFVGESAKKIMSSLDDLGIDLAQVYEDVNVPEEYKKRMIYSLQITHEKEVPSSQVLEKYGYILLDAPKFHDGLMGGTGRCANWALAKKLAKKYQLILAGGLSPENISHAIDEVFPFAVDVASGIESVPGIKDRLLTKQFLEKCDGK